MNAGYDAQEVVVKLVQQYRDNGCKIPVGLDIASGEACSPEVCFIIF